MKKIYKIEYKNESINLGGSKKDGSNELTNTLTDLNLNTEKKSTLTNDQMFGSNELTNTLTELNPNTEKKSSLTEKQMYDIKEKIDIDMIEAGSILYRCQLENCILNERSCEDTGKRGIYFSDRQFIPYGMIVEYDKPMYLCEYRTNKDIFLYRGKYSFRNLESHRFYNNINDYKNQNFIQNVKPLENYNHIDNTLFPITDLFLSQENANLWDRIDAGAEIFLNNKNDVTLIKNHGLVSVEEAKNYILNKLDLIKELTKIEDEIYKL